MGETILNQIKTRSQCDPTQEAQSKQWLTNQPILKMSQINYKIRLPEQISSLPLLLPNKTLFYPFSDSPGKAGPCTQPQKVGPKSSGKTTRGQNSLAMFFFFPQNRTSEKHFLVLKNTASNRGSKLICRSWVMDKCRFIIVLSTFM